MVKKKAGAKNQKGGIVIEGDHKVAFEYFMMNSTVQYFSKGSNGIIFKALLNEGKTSFYTHYDYYNFNKNVKNLIFKLILLHDSPRRDIGVQLFSDVKMNICPTEEFISEVNIQTDVYLKTIHYLNPICPPIVYATTYDFVTTEDDKKEKLNNLFSLFQTTDNLVLSIIKALEEGCLKGRITKLGLIAMQLAESYFPVKQIIIENIKNENYNHIMDYLSACRYIIMKLVNETGYSHGDFHLSNILLIKINGFYIPLLIDFGYSIPFPSNKLIEFRRRFNSQKYLKCIQSICEAGSKVNKSKKFFDWHSYLWFCNPRKDPNQILLKDFIQTLDEGIVKNFFLKMSSTLQMDEIIENNIKHFYSLEQIRLNNCIEVMEYYHKNNPEVYPKLPLSNTVKNKMFVGLYDETTNTKTKMLEIRKTIKEQLIPFTERKSKNMDVIQTKVKSSSNLSRMTSLSKTRKRKNDDNDDNIETTKI
jgi:hypothetical protein